MAEFLTMVKVGKVTKGSVLVVESLDRLSREDELTAVEFFISILRSGISMPNNEPRILLSA